MLIKKIRWQMFQHHITDFQVFCHKRPSVMRVKGITLEFGSLMNILVHDCRNQRSQKSLICQDKYHDRECSGSRVEGFCGRIGESYM